jgi:hypothetical protein
MRHWVLGTLLASAALALLGTPTPMVAQAPVEMPTWPGFCYEQDRFGFWDVAGAIELYDVAQLHAGWYSHYTVLEDPPRPGGLRFAQLVRISDDGPLADAACSRCPTWDEVRAIAQENPGSLWLIGNEPDRQDYIVAERYAQIYHDFYSFLKAEDASAQVAIGGVVQATPIRLQYLDMILDSYQATYSETMPIDVWNVHNYVLREKHFYPGCPDCWGCDIPPGTDPALAIEYELNDHDLLDAHPTDPERIGWKAQLTLMREWMRDRGYQDRPLIISEFGILMSLYHGYDYPRVRNFMLETFEWLTTTTDPDIGYPADGNRLVQAWAWYSLAQSTFEWYPMETHLFDPQTRAITELGLDFGAYTAPLTTPFLGTIDLRPGAVHHSSTRLGGSATLTATVTAEIHNGGASPAENVLVRFERDGLPAGETILPTIAGGQSQWATALWPGLDPGFYEATITVDPGAQIGECNRGNNQRSARLGIVEHRIYLPLIWRSG